MAEKKMLTQVDLVSDDRRMTTWLDSRPGVRVGSMVKLKDTDDTWWAITAVYETRPEHQVNNRGFDNNDYSKHEGLFK